MPYACNGNAKIYYEVMGDNASPPMLFIGGFSAQIVGWQEDFCRLFVERGFQVIRFDNRDVGWSPQFDGTQGHEPGYTLYDMADEAFSQLRLGASDVARGLVSRAVDSGIGVPAFSSRAHSFARFPAGGPVSTLR